MLQGKGLSHISARGQSQMSELIAFFLSLQPFFDPIDPLGINHFDLLHITGRNHGGAFYRLHKRTDEEI